MRAVADLTWQSAPDALPVLQCRQSQPELSHILWPTCHRCRYALEARLSKFFAGRCGRAAPA